jgi:hypothetical protein
MCCDDLDGFLVYSTPKVVKIKDKGLAVLNLVLMAAILCYIIFYEIIARFVCVCVVHPSAYLDIIVFGFLQKRILPYRHETSCKQFI